MKRVFLLIVLVGLTASAQEVTREQAIAARQACEAAKGMAEMAEMNAISFQVLCIGEDWETFGSGGMRWEAVIAGSNCVWQYALDQGDAQLDIGDYRQDLGRTKIFQGRNHYGSLQGGAYHQHHVLANSEFDLGFWASAKADYEGATAKYNLAKAKWVAAALDGDAGYSALTSARDWYLSGSQGYGP